jgi:hypothetical protein
MKLTKIALGVTLGLGGAAANAYDVAMFPHVIASNTVTTIVTVIDIGDPNVFRFNPSGLPGQGSGYDRLHWHLDYKSGNDAGSNTAACGDFDYYLPTSPNDMQTVDLGGQFSGPSDAGVLFNDPSINNNWKGKLGGSLTYALGTRTGLPMRGVLFVNNASDNTQTLTNTVQGEAMVFEFDSGAAWGYTALKHSGFGSSAFDFSAYGSSQDAKATVTFKPFDETATALLVTPLNEPGNSMLDQYGGPNATSGLLTTLVTLKTANPTAGTAYGVAFDLDENLVSGAVVMPVTCVGRVDIKDLMTSGAQAVLGSNGGYGYLLVQAPTSPAATATDRAAIYKLEYNNVSPGTFNGVATNGVYNNSFLIPPQ